MRDATATDEIPVYSIGKAKPEALIVFEMPYSMRKASSLII
jgi:hypothetical protein